MKKISKSPENFWTNLCRIDSEIYKGISRRIPLGYFKIFQKKFHEKLLEKFLKFFFGEFDSSQEPLEQSRKNLWRRVRSQGVSRILYQSSLQLQKKTLSDLFGWLRGILLKIEPCIETVSILKKTCYKPWYRFYFTSYHSILVQIYPIDIALNLKLLLRSGKRLVSALKSYRTLHYTNPGSHTWVADFFRKKKE